MNYKYYPSSAAFAYGDIVLTDYESGCLRAILINAHGVKNQIPQIYAAVGAAHEDWNEERLKTDPRIQSYQREVSLRYPIPGFEAVTYSGRADVLVTYANGTDAVLETKGTISKNTRGAVIGQGKVKLNHLAQLASYFTATKRTRGKIIVGYYEDLDGKLICQEHREFKVTVADDGGILVDGVGSGFSVMDQIRHRNMAAEVLLTGRIANRPDKAEQAWGGPCGKCKFKAVCDKYDAGEIAAEDFVSEGVRAGNSAPASEEPVPHKAGAKYRGTDYHRNKTKSEG